MLNIMKYNGFGSWKTYYTSIIKVRKTVNLVKLNGRETEWKVDE